MNLKNIVKLYEDIVPLEYEENWDNSGLQLGEINSEILKILISLDLDNETIDYAVNNNYNLIFIHHPIIFSPIKNIVDTDILGKKLIKCIKNNINVYSSHTNLDNYAKGTSYILAKKLNLNNIEKLEEKKDIDIGTGVIGEKDFFDNNELIEYIKSKLSIKNVVFYGDLSKRIQKIAIVGGSGSFLIDEAINKKADILITGDIKYHEADMAVNKGINLIDIGHYDSEKYVLEKIKELLKKITNNSIDIKVLYKKEDFRKII